MCIKNETKLVTKNVQITMTATIEKRYTEVVQVPADITSDELNALVNQRYDVVGADEYSEVGDSWDSGFRSALETLPTAQATVIANREGAGIVAREIALPVEVQPTVAVAALAPNIIYLTDDSSNALADLPHELLTKLPVSVCRQFSVKPYIVSLNEVWHVLGELVVPFRGAGWGAFQPYPVKSDAELACARLIQFMHAQAQPGDVVFPLQEARMSDAFILKGAIKVDLSDTQGTIAARLDNLFFGKLGHPADIT